MMTVTRNLSWVALFALGLGKVPSAAWGYQAQAAGALPQLPAAAAGMFVKPDDLDWEQVLAEPQVAQPVFLNFDERGRMWVVQYLQYPEPAGVKLQSRDNVWRAVYDRVPAPPPNHVKGADKITIHEDTDGDGVFDLHKTFVENLNICTAVARGRGGVWVLNPPYLLFYPDADGPDGNGDDVPDGDPEVRLAGFGLEDTHSVCNSLRFGPDGWLYGAQGSTVTGNVIRPGIDKKPVQSLGQLIWRYHPGKRIYEIFAEGGGNAFGCEIDSLGRIYSGHNGGDTRGFHYVQGGYYQKGFAKHGALSNPYTFGYFAQMPHPTVPRFTHDFVIYEGGAFPTGHEGRLFGVAPLLNHVVESEITPLGSTFRTQDLGLAISTSDPWFRPVDIELGPDGGLYVCDWYDGQVNHYKNHEGQIDKSNGRIYRLRAKGAKNTPKRNLGRLTSDELVDLLEDSNRWTRHAALRLLGDREDSAILPRLRERFLLGPTERSLDAMWAIHLCGGFDESFARQALAHANPYARLWAVRLLCDEKSVSPEIAKTLVRLAETEPNVEARAQLACSARRLPATEGLAITRALLARDEDVDDPYLPLLLWWSIEARVENDPLLVLALFEDPKLWTAPLVERHMLARLSRRFAQAGSRRDLSLCAELFEKAPSAESRKPLMAGFEEGLQGRALVQPPDSLIAALAKSGGLSLGLRLRQGAPMAIEEALAKIQGKEASLEERVRLIAVIGEIRPKGLASALLATLESEPAEASRGAILAALAGYDDDEIGATVTRLFDSLSDESRDAAVTLLASRQGWTRVFLAAVEAGQVAPAGVSLAAARRLVLRPDREIEAQVTKFWGPLEGATTAEMRAQVERLATMIESAPGNPYSGKAEFAKTCAKCHTLFAEGGKIGPDLTGYKRDDLRVMLLHVVNPSAEIREGFENRVAILADGRMASGFLTDQDRQVLSLRGADGQTQTIPRDEIEELQVSPRSIMPDDLLRGMSDERIRDLFAYLRSTQPLVRANSKELLLSRGGGRVSERFGQPILVAADFGRELFDECLAALEEPISCSRPQVAARLGMFRVQGFFPHSLGPGGEAGAIVEQGLDQEGHHQRIVGLQAFGRL